MKRVLVLTALGVSLGCASSSALAHADIGVFLGVPGPVYAAPPPVVYQPPPVVYQSPPVVYAPVPAYGYGYQDEYREERRWHDNGRHRGWYKHHHDDDDD
ncbi:hypothetical protein VSR69_03935 [Paraburkholderia phytofirmans]|uniref:PXPV repeat-containing protein n=1 Tax=Paraburkholderia dipogonis TaxID=1211383 RepID=A0ABW9B0J6_9BURK|nr:hypothetical protein [Paraburkholderia sp. BL9I2N2]TCK96344.1 hypothetical protein B0G74_3007 [Paraburkholderia sp. BL9I2N2]